MRLFDPVSPHWLPEIRRWHLRGKLLRLEVAEIFLLTFLLLAVLIAPALSGRAALVAWLAGACLAFGSGVVGYFILRLHRALATLGGR